jgi:hypothetical protein
MSDEEKGGAENPALGLSGLWTSLPPLDWTYQKLTGTWLDEGEMALCPLHEEDTPSFNLWAPDDEGVPTRWGCFGCGRRGDVVDLIAELEHVDAVEALRRAEELSKEVATAEPVKRKHREVSRAVVDHATLLDQITTGMGTKEFDLLVNFMRDKGMGGESLERYAMNEWRWAATHRKVVMPHVAPDGMVTGIKYRVDKKRSNEEPSRFPFLYGSWRDRGRPRVFLAEGETDTVYGAYQLREDDDFDVFGLPSGAAQAVREEWLERLKGRDLVLGFDSDEEGMAAAARWGEKRPDALVARLPEGEDVVSCGIPVRELIERAEVPRRHSGMVTVQNDVFVMHTQKGNAPVADFAFWPKRELFTDEGPAWEGYITGDRRLTLVRASDLHTGAAVTRWANRHGRSWTGGSGPAVQGVFNWLAARSAYLPLEQATTKAGKIGRSFVGPEFCVGPDRVRYIPPAFGDAKLASRLAVRQGAWDPRALHALEQMNDPAVMATVLGWLCATLLRGERAPAPPLFVSGESGSGKTNMLSTLLGAFGFNVEVNLTTTTPYGVDCVVSSTVGFPVWFDEYRGGAREDSMQRLRQLLRDAYYGQPSLKGGMKTQTTELSEVTTWAGIVVSGEMASDETSIRDRIVMLNLDPGARRREPFSWLQDRGRTEGLGYALLEFLARRADTLFQVRPAGNDDLPDRFRETLGFVLAGWDAWKEFRWEQGLRDAPEGPDVMRLARGRAEAEDPWLEAIKACQGVVARNGGDEIVRETDEGVIILAGELVVEARRVGIELPARANELVAWLKRRYTVYDKRTPLGRRAKLVVGMKLDA